MRGEGDGLVWFDVSWKIMLGCCCSVVAIGCVTIRLVMRCGLYDIFCFFFICPTLCFRGHSAVLVEVLLLLVVLSSEGGLGNCLLGVYNVFLFISFELLSCAWLAS